MENDPFAKFPPDRREQRSGNPTRREFLRKSVDVATFGLSAAAVGTLLGPLAWEYEQNNFDADELERGIHSIQEDLLARYGLKAGISLRDFPSSYEHGGVTTEVKPVDSLYLRYKAMENLRQLVELYPTNFIRSNISEVRITDEITHSGGLSEKDVVVLGTTSIREKFVVVNIQLLFQDLLAIAGQVLPERNLHHEFSHAVTGNVPEEQWEKLHPGVQYVLFGYTLIADEPVPPGFARSYGRMNYLEDMATVAELLFGDPGTLRDKVEHDQILSRKVDFIKGIYLRKSNELMNDAFWSDLGAGKVDRSYWEDREIR